MLQDLLVLLSTIQKMFHHLKFSVENQTIIISRIQYEPIYGKCMIFEVKVDLVENC
jgi:hypothetical protein